MPGACRGIPDLVLYFALDQILPVSFTINLFLLAVLLGLEFHQPPATTSWSAPKATNQVLLVTAYFIALSVAPSMRDTSRLIPTVFLTRLLLFCPYLVLRPKMAPLANSRKGCSDISGKLYEKDKLWQAYIPATLTGAFGCLTLQFRHSMTGTTTTISKQTTLALDNDSAISALGYDLVIAVASWFLWYATGPKGKEHVR